MKNHGCEWVQLEINPLVEVRGPHLVCNLIIWVLPKHCKKWLTWICDRDICSMLGKKSKHILPKSGLMVMNPMVQSVQNHLKKQVQVSRDPLQRNE